MKIGVSVSAVHAGSAPVGYEGGRGVPTARSRRHQSVVNMTRMTTRAWVRNIDTCVLRSADRFRSTAPQEQVRPQTGAPRVAPPGCEPPSSTHRRDGGWRLPERELLRER